MCLYFTNYTHDVSENAQAIRQCLEIESVQRFADWQYFKWKIDEIHCENFE